MVRQFFRIFKNAIFLVCGAGIADIKKSGISAALGLS
jgi:hypothetical protein